jgi:hypothetical protein
MIERSTGANETAGLSTGKRVKRRIAPVIGTGPTGISHGSLHPQRPSGRSPHRPLTFFYIATPPTRLESSSPVPGLLVNAGVCARISGYNAFHLVGGDSNGSSSV